MDINEKYDELIRSLAKHRPVLADRDQLTDRIMNGITRPDHNRIPERSLNNYAFSWVHNPWFRSVMASAAAVFIALFVVQQVSITKRMSNLEDQLVKTVKSINGGQELDVKHRLMIQTFLNVNTVEDSVMVSRKDLERLLTAWMKAENMNEEITGDPAYNDYIRELIRNRAGETPEKNKSTKNL